MKVEFLQRPASEQSEPSRRPFNTWRYSPEDEPWCEFFREEQHYRVRFSGLADFLIQEGGRVVVAIPSHDVDDATLEHLYLNQVLPLALNSQGVPVFHGSAVSLDDQAIAFLGDSGAGKSTLATSYALAGHPLITDDGLLLEDSGGGFLAHPSHPSVRLWDDSREALIGDRLPEMPAISYSSKARFLASESLPLADVALPLRRAFFLGDGDAEEIRIAPMTASEAAVEWVKHSFVLDPVQRMRLTSHFGQIGKLAAQNLSFRLDYPRHFDNLPLVRAAIAAHLREQVKK